MQTPPHTTFASAANPHVPRYRYRLRWDNLLIVAAAVGISALVVPLLMRVDQTASSIKARQAAIGTQASSGATTTAPTTTRAEGAAGGVSTVEDANRVVAGARLAMLDGRFDEASRLLGSVSGELADKSGASALRDENARRQSEFERHVLDVRTAVQARRWREAATAAGQARQLAPLPADVERLAAGAARQLAAARAYRRALQMFEANDLGPALQSAQRGVQQYDTPQFSALVRRIHAVQAQRAIAKRKRAARRRKAAAEALRLKAAAATAAATSPSSGTAASATAPAVAPAADPAVAGTAPEAPRTGPPAASGLAAADAG